MSMLPMIFMTKLIYLSSLPNFLRRAYITRKSCSRDSRSTPRAFLNLGLVTLILLAVHLLAYCTSDISLGTNTRPALANIYDRDAEFCLVLERVSLPLGGTRVDDGDYESEGAIGNILSGFVNAQLDQGPYPELFGRTCVMDSDNPLLEYASLTCIDYEAERQRLGISLTSQTWAAILEAYDVKDCKQRLCNTSDEQRPSPNVQSAILNRCYKDQGANTIMVANNRTSDTGDMREIDARDYLAYCAATQDEYNTFLDGDCYDNKTVHYQIGGETLYYPSDDTIPETLRGKPVVFSCKQHKRWVDYCHNEGYAYTKGTVPDANTSGITLVQAHCSSCDMCPAKDADNDGYTAIDIPGQEDGDFRDKTGMACVGHRLYDPNDGTRDTSELETPERNYQDIQQVYDLTVRLPNREERETSLRRYAYAVAHTLGDTLIHDTQKADPVADWRAKAKNKCRSLFFGQDNNPFDSALQLQQTLYDFLGDSSLGEGLLGQLAQANELQAMYTRKNLRNQYYGVNVPLEVYHRASVDASYHPPTFASAQTQSLHSCSPNLGRTIRVSNPNSVSVLISLPLADDDTGFDQGSLADDVFYPDQNGNELIPSSDVYLLNSAIPGLSLFSLESNLSQGQSSVVKQVLLSESVDSNSSPGVLMQYRFSIGACDEAKAYPQTGASTTPSYALHDLDRLDAPKGTGETDDAFHARLAEYDDRVQDLCYNNYLVNDVYTPRSDNSDYDTEGTCTGTNIDDTTYPVSTGIGTSQNYCVRLLPPASANISGNWGQEVTFAADRVLRPYGRICATHSGDTALGKGITLHNKLQNCGTDTNTLYLADNGLNHAFRDALQYTYPTTNTQENVVFNAVQLDPGNSFTCPETASSAIMNTPELFGGYTGGSASVFSPNDVSPRTLNLTHDSSGATSTGQDLYVVFYPLGTIDGLGRDHLLFPEGSYLQEYPVLLTIPNDTADSTDDLKGLRENAVSMLRRTQRFGLHELNCPSSTTTNTSFCDGEVTFTVEITAGACQP